MTVIDTGPRDADSPQDLDEATAADHIHGICLKTGPPRRVGVELEWLVRDARDPALPVPAGRIAAAVQAFGATAGDGDDDQGDLDSRQGDRDAGRVERNAGHGERGPRGPGRDGPENQDLSRQDPGGRQGPGAQSPGEQAPGGHGLADGDDRERGEARRAAPDLPTSTRPGILPSGALLTSEPGGQLEISSQPADSLASLVRATREDLTALRAALAADGLEIAGLGLDPLRPPRRVLNLPRYAAMEAYFDSGGPWGRQMMCGTASVQVCLDAGDDSDGPDGYRWRWRLLHAVGPVLVSAFANSPLREGKPTGWVSSRQQVWTRMDPGRTRPPRLDEEPREAWTRYALDAGLMCVPGAETGDWTAPPGLTLREWVRASPREAVSGGGNGNGNGGRLVDARAATALAGWASAYADLPGWVLTGRPAANGSAGHQPAGHRSAGNRSDGNGSAGGSAGHGQALAGAGSGAHGNGALRRPTVADLDYHLSTLFPPVRPRGHFELRMIDAQSGEDGWIVPLAVCTALLSDARAAEAALAAVAPLWGGRPPGWPGSPGAGSGNGHEGIRDDDPWLRAARLGPADPAISRASRECFAAAREALDRMAVPADITATVDAFTARYVSRDRCPADDLLEEAK
jgi:glutamate--cysteine ligase